MQKKRPWLSLLIAAAACAAAAVVPARGLAADEPERVVVVAADPALPVAAMAGVPRPSAQQAAGDGRVAASERRRAEAQLRNRNRAANTAAAGGSPGSAGPRLQLDPQEPALSEEALAIERAIEVVAYAASAARSSASAASAARGRISSLERTVSELRSETQIQRERLSGQDHRRRWIWLLGAAVLLLGGLALWLARRLVRVQREYEQRWLSVAATAALPPAAALAGRPSAPAALAAADVRRLTADKAPLPPAWPPPVKPQGWDEPPPPVTQSMAATAPRPRQFVPDTAMQRTEPLLPNVHGAGDQASSSPRDVSIEELIDLEQQAEFFVVLGQDDAAIELLAEHLRNTGGGSPLPYLKLLEIHRRRGEHEAYERIRSRFNQRFNAYAPEWGTDLAHGRSLEGYAGILPRLQQAWPRPMDAMAEMEALLFRKSRGDLFDLPAYRELLFLYSLARDLLDREGADGDTVDLLLPLSGAGPRGADFGNTAPVPFLGLEGEAESWKKRGDASREERPTLPLDFDLSVEGQRQTSIFDPLDKHGKPQQTR